ncbi:hypothetical protein BDW02DRAFT_580341 [Decorospora gaudefroyi]|uniref:Ubiquitin 3 binding protein But2 C-terminal domain-containing protein n=1 Tax=Decorospora gaudefroyi TaxID=184978 RepID=A0A6A5KDP4_9PLEO|nr:hypothetical protein BDW02DRAFT_580341 [Decorospora gaudefroyi]
MLTTHLSILTALLLRPTLSAPYPPSNTTLPPNLTICNSTNLSLCPNNLTTPNLSPPENICRTIYPTTLSILNSRYPNYADTRLHSTTQFFMLRRQTSRPTSPGEIETRIQFHGLPTSSSNTSCRLEFVLPQEKLERIAGPNPSFAVYRVDALPQGVAATWDSARGYREHGVWFGAVNGELEALRRTRQGVGVAAVNQTACNETMAFHMGMLYDSLVEPNFWSFANVAPPAWPVQGWRIVWGC